MASPKFPSEIAGPISNKPRPAEALLRECVAQALKNCSRQKTREQVARELSDVTGLTITKRMVNDWASPSKTHPRLPAILIEPLAHVTGTQTLERAVIGPNLSKLIDLGARVNEFAGVLDKLREEVKKILQGNGSPRMRKKRQARWR